MEKTLGDLAGCTARGDEEEGVSAEETARLGGRVGPKFSPAAEEEEEQVAEWR